MKQPSKPHALVTGLLLAAAFAGGACGNHGRQASTTTSSAAATSSPSASETTTPPSSAGSPGDPVARGKSLVAQFSCQSCHSTTGARLVGPTWKGLAGSKVELTDGQTVVADHAYLVRSIEDPDAQIVEGFPKGVMSAVIKPGLVEPEDADAIAAYIESLASR